MEDITNEFEDNYPGEDQAIFESRNIVRLESSNMGESSSMAASRQLNSNPSIDMGIGLDVNYWEGMEYITNEFEDIYHPGGPDPQMDHIALAAQQIVEDQ